MQENSTHHNNQQRLIIRISHNSLSFADVKDDGQVGYIPYPMKSGISMAANLREAFQTQPVLNATYARVMVMTDTPVLMVPTEEYQESDQRLLYQHAFQGRDKDDVLSTVLPDLNCVAVFSINHDLKTVITDHYSQPLFIAAVAPVWRHLHQRSYMGVRAKLYGYFHDRHLDLFAFGQHRFKFCNSFDIHDEHDALYFILYVWKQLGMQAEHDEMHIVGNPPEKEWLTEELQKYLKRVYVINPAGDFNRSAVTQIEGMPYDLMALFVKGR